MDEYTKKERRALRELLEKAYERDLGRALEVVEEAFRSWRRGDIDAFEVNEIIHRNHQGESRDLYVRYATGGSRVLDTLVAGAVLDGVLGREEIPEALRDRLERRIEMLEQIRRRS